MNKTFENCTLLDTFSWFKKARPEATAQDFRAQLGVHLEEVAEMLEVLDGSDLRTNALIGRAEQAMKELAEHIKSNSAEDIITVTSEDLFLDSLCDQVVTATGVAYTRGYDFVGAMTEVNASNFSKFDEQGNPIYNENRKVMKGPAYFKAELSPFLQS
jgi:hypothetical protein